MEPPGKEGWREGSVGIERLVKQGLFSVWFVKWRNLIMSLTDDMGERWESRWKHSAWKWQEAIETGTEDHGKDAMALIQVSSPSK